MTNTQEAFEKYVEAKRDLVRQSYVNQKSAQNFVEEERKILEHDQELAERVYENCRFSRPVLRENSLAESCKRINAGRTYESDLDYKCFSVLQYINKSFGTQFNTWLSNNIEDFYNHFHKGLEERSLNEVETSYLVNLSEKDILRDLGKFKNIFSKKISLDNGRINIGKIKRTKPFEGVSHSGAGLFAC